MKTIYLAGGCFWGMEAYFKMVEGIVNTEVGYANGNMANPRYEDLKNHLANHAETLKLDYDENIISLERILDIYLGVINPFNINHQGEDYGVQYRTGIYTEDKEELNKIRHYMAHKELEMKKGLFAIEIEPLQHFYLAEDYHQDYLDKNPGGYCHISIPKEKIK